MNHVKHQLFDSALNISLKFCLNRKIKIGHKPKKIVLNRKHVPAHILKKSSYFEFLLESIVLSQRQECAAAGSACSHLTDADSNPLSNIYNLKNSYNKKGSDAVRHCICAIVRRKRIFNVGTNLFIFST